MGMAAIHQATHRTEAVLDSWAGQLRERFGWREPIRIVLYQGYGAQGGHFRVRGRVLAGEEGVAAENDDGVWRNFGAMLRRFASKEVAGAEIRVELGGGEAELVADEEGYFLLEGHTEVLRDGDGEGLWRDVEAELMGPRPEGQRTFFFPGRVQVPREASFGVISDLDDTVVRTGATNFATMLQTTFLNNEHTRAPFVGVEPFYRALQRGREGGKARNPFFYVSSSPWNLYDFLISFLDVHQIPQGTLFLQDLGLDDQKFLKSGHGAHKLAAIEEVLSTYPELKFILVGDSGQHDPEIYRQVVEQHPHRILAVYIRDVTPLSRDDEVRRIAREVVARGVPMMLAEDLAPCAEHAARSGWISVQDAARVGHMIEEEFRQQALQPARRLEQALLPRSPGGRLALTFCAGALLGVAFGYAMAASSGR